MAFPTTSVLDNFNRANGALGSNWLAGFGDTLAAVNTNQARGAAAGWSGSIWSPAGTPATFSDPQEGYYTLAAADASAQPAGIVARGTNLNTGTYSGYIAYLNGSNAPVIGRYTAGTFLQLASAVAVTPAAGDKIGIEVIGTTSPVSIRLYYAPAGVWPGAPTLTFSDSSSPLTTGGQLGMSWNQTGANTNGADDFGGGTTSAGTNATVTAPAATGLGDIPNPTLLADAAVTSPAAAGAGDIPAPTVSASTPDATVTAPPMMGLGDIPAAAMDLSSEVQTGPLSALGDIPAPTVAGNLPTDGTVAAVPAVAAGDIPAPTVVASSTITAPPLAAAGDIVRPAVSPMVAPLGDYMLLGLA